MPSETIVQTTVAGNYLNTTSYYSYEALRAYENTYAHGDNAGYLWTASLPLITVRAYDTFAQVLKGYTQLNYVSKVALVDNFGGAPGYDGLTLHFENLLPSDAGEGATNTRWNSITLSDRSLSDLGANSVEELNAQILAGNNPFLMTNQTVDDFGTHGYLHIA
jgi:hypothetical protein